MSSKTLFPLNIRNLLKNECPLLIVLIRLVPDDSLLTKSNCKYTQYGSTQSCDEFKDIFKTRVPPVTE